MRSSGSGVAANMNIIIGPYLLINFLNISKRSLDSLPNAYLPVNASMYSVSSPNVAPKPLAIDINIGFNVDEAPK